MYFSIVSLDGRELGLCGNSPTTQVKFADLGNYIQAVKASRLEELRSHLRFDAIHRGLIKIIPANLLRLFTWQVAIFFFFLFFLRIQTLFIYSRVFILLLFDD